MQDSNKIAFELLKLTFFAVTYLLIADNIGSTNECHPNNYLSFYNTLFIFSASTWVDYLSILGIHLKKRYYEGNDIEEFYIPIIGSIIGTFTVIISMYCVCKNDTNMLVYAKITYCISSIYLIIKSYSITSMIIKEIDNK